MLSLPTTHAVTLEASPIASSSMKRLPISPEGRDYRYAKSSRTPVPLRPLATTSAQSDSSHQECPSSPLTPLWTGAFPTGSTSRSPASSMSIESCVVTPQMEYFAWGAQAHKDKEFISRQTSPVLEAPEDLTPTFPSRTLYSLDEPGASRTRKYASTDLKKQFPGEALSMDARRVSKSQSRCVDAQATDLARHRRSLSQNTSKRTSAASERFSVLPTIPADSTLQWHPLPVMLLRTVSSGDSLKDTSRDSPNIFPRRRYPVPDLDVTVGAVSTTKDELASMAEAAEMALRRRTRSAPFRQPYSESCHHSLLLTSQVVDKHRRSASLGGERLDFVHPQQQQLIVQRRLRTASQASRSSRTSSNVDEATNARSSHTRTSSLTKIKPGRRSPPPPPMLAATPPPLPVLPVRSLPPPTRAPPPIPIDILAPVPRPLRSPLLSAVRAPTSPLEHLLTPPSSLPPIQHISPLPLPSFPSDKTLVAKASIADSFYAREEIRREATAAIREAESWDWPVPPPIARRLSPVKAYFPPISSPSQLGYLSSPRTEPGLASPFASSIKLQRFAWETDAGTIPAQDSLFHPDRRDSGVSSAASGFEEPPRASSSNLSSELGPLTPDEVHDDPFDKQRRSVQPSRSLPQLSPPKTARKHRSTISPRFGVPF